MPQEPFWRSDNTFSTVLPVSLDLKIASTAYRQDTCTSNGYISQLYGQTAASPHLRIAAQVAFPRRQCVGFVGDGGFTMLMGEFANCVKHRLPVKIVILKNNSLGQIKWEQMVFLGNPEFACDLHPIDFAQFAQACGGRGYTIEDPAECGDILSEFLNHPGPALCQAVVDANEPPLPPKVRLRQAAHFAEALARGTPHAGRIALTVLSDKVREMI